MPLFGGPSQGSTGDIWLRNKPTIERFYVIENKTAEEVMEVMERDYGCPRITKKAFQKIIRNKLKLSKRLKKGDWLRIYRYYLVNRKGLPTVVYRNNRKILWKDVMKEVKRSGRLPTTGQDGDATLPMDVVLRTPSPSPSPAGSQMSYSPATNPQQSTGSSPQPSTSSPTAPVVSLAGNLPTSTIRDINNALNGIPWIKFNYRMLSTATSPHDSDTNLPLDLNSLRTLIDTRLGLDSFRIWKAAFPSTKLHFLSSMPSSFALTPDINVYYLLAKVVYLTSNNLHYSSNRYHNIFTRTIQLLSCQIPKEVLDGLFQQDLSILRIIWEHLTECAGISSYRDTFTSLIKVGFQHKRWLLPEGDLYLSFAASMNALDVVQDLLNVGIRADDVVRGREYPVIIEAAAAGNIECMKLLLGACDVNGKIRCNRSSFQILIFAFVEGEFRIPTNQNYLNLSSFPKGIRSGQFTTVRVNLRNESQHLILKMFLDCGANVDLPWATRLTTDNQVLYDVPEEWCPTTLEKIQYWDKSLFEELAPYSTVTTGRSFRQNIYVLASQGKEYLREYLSLQSAESGSMTKASLELVLFQQIINDKIIDIEDVRINIDIIRGLLEFGVDTNLRSLKSYTKYEYCDLGIHDLLQHLVLKPDVHRFGKSFDTVLRLILRSGATITPGVLAAGVQKEGIDILEALRRVGADVRRYGASALVLAARFDNYDAVKWLLDSGVDINAVVLDQSVIALASWSDIRCLRCRMWSCRHWKLSDPASCEMLRYLVDRGATLKNHPGDSNSFQFLYHLLLRYEANGSISNMMELFLPKLRPHDLLPPDKSKSLWEACLHSEEQHYPDEKQAKTRKEKIAVLELLLKHGLLVQDDLALPSLVDYRGPPELIERLLESCMDIDTYIEDLDFTRGLIQSAAYQGDKALVEKLLQKGADINQSKVPFWGRTALQVACDWRQVAAGEEAKRVGLIQLLIEKGADINDPGRICNGYTALRYAVVQGNIEVVLLLISEGAVINTPDNHMYYPSTKYKYYALDLATSLGRLDIVHLLLNVGALSGSPGQTGYDGAIEVAEECRHFAVADLIRQHVGKDLRDN